MNIFEHLRTSLRVMERLETSLHHLFTSCIENTLSKANHARRAGDGVRCSIVAVIAEKVMKSGKMGIAILAIMPYYRDATQVEY